MFQLQGALSNQPKALDLPELFKVYIGGCWLRGRRIAESRSFIICSSCSRRILVAIRAFHIILMKPCALARLPHDTKVNCDSIAIAHR